MRASNSKSDKDSDTARGPTTSEDSHTARDPTTSEDSHTARDPTVSEDNHTARDPVESDDSNISRDPKESENSKTPKAPGSGTEQSNSKGVQENSCFQNQDGHGVEEYDMTSVMYNRDCGSPSTAKAVEANKKKPQEKK